MPKIDWNIVVYRDVSGSGSAWFQAHRKFSEPEFRLTEIFHEWKKMSYSVFSTKYLLVIIIFVSPLNSSQPWQTILNAFLFQDYSQYHSFCLSMHQFRAVSGMLFKSCRILPELWTVHMEFNCLNFELGWLHCLALLLNDYLY